MEIEWKPSSAEGVYTLFIEEDQVCDVHRSIFGRSPSFPPFSSLAEWPEVFDAFEYKRAKRYLIWLLTRKSYHSEEIEKTLKQKLVQKKTVERLIKEFKQEGYLDDEEWLQRFVSAKIKKEGFFSILTKLRLKGLSQETIQAVKESFSPSTEEETVQIEAIIRKKAARKNLKDQKEKKKLIASLARKGFSLDAIFNSFTIIEKEL